MKKAFPIGAAAAFAALYGCASEPLPAEALQPLALSAAQQRGAADLGCPAASGQILSKETIKEAQGTGWSEYPHRAAYTVDVSGCGKHTTYSVTCDDRQKSCTAGPVAVSSAPRQLADDLRPSAVSAAQQKGMSDLGCEAVTTNVLSQETISGGTTGWGEIPPSAAYTIDVSGCGKRTTYLVSCDNLKTNCTLGKKAEGVPAQLADNLRPEAVSVAQQRGAADLICPAATTKVLSQETIAEATTTGWSETSHRAEYTIDVLGAESVRRTRSPATTSRRTFASLAAYRSDSRAIALHRVDAEITLRQQVLASQHRIRAEEPSPAVR